MKLIPKLKQITNSIMKDALFAMNDDELYLVINYLESIIELKAVKRGLRES